jgi:carbonic anhydrase/acetyltransferase-like protein (isoleucine patch superfamily)
MLIEHLGKAPSIDASAWVAPDATLCGDVTLGAESRVMHGARIIAEGGRIEIGARCIVMENAVVRAAGGHDCRIGDHVLIGPLAHVVGATIEEEVFIATGAAVFHGSRLGRGAEVRVHAIVHLKTDLPAGATVPIGWIACGAPAQLFSPDRHEALWAVQAPLNFPLTVYGLGRATPDLMRAITERVSQRLASHRDDKPVGDA